MPVKVGLKYIEIWKESLEEQICAYEKEERKKGQIVFYGPSSFTRWSERFGIKPISEVLLGKSGKPCVINRGFGSSSSEHQLYYYPRMVRPLEPAVLVYSCYANGQAFGYSLEEIWELGQRVIAYAKTDFPDIHIYICGACHKKNLTEEEYKKGKTFDKWVKEYAEKTENCHFVNILDFEPMADRNDIFVEDGAHYNQDGYNLYAKLFRKTLENELARY